MADGKFPAESKANTADKAVETLPGKIRHPVRKIILALLAAIVLTATIWVIAARHQNQQVLNRIRDEYLELKSKADTVTDIKSRRVEFFRIQSFLNSPSRVAFTAATFVRKLGSVDSSRLLFSELKLVPGNQTIFFRIKAFIQSGEKSKQTDIAEVFCRQLKGWNEIFDVSWSLENSKNSESTLPVLIVSGKVELE